MMKPSKVIWFTALAVATACRLEPASAEVFEGDGCRCHGSSDFLVLYPGSSNRWGYLNKMSTVGGLSVKQCFELCNETEGCVAVAWGKFSNQPASTCSLYSSSEGLQPVAIEKTSVLYACIKLPFKGKIPRDDGPHQEIPPTIPFDPRYRQDEQRPGPPPGPCSGRR
jgi:hypothetical protein